MKIAKNCFWSLLEALKSPFQENKISRPGEQKRGALDEGLF
jgi:hypothetical protein